jgi:hypothetical protein
MKNPLLCSRFYSSKVFRIPENVSTTTINPAFGVESLVELADNGLVLRRMAEENAEPSAGLGHEGFPERGRLVKLYGRILLKSLKLVIGVVTNNQNKTACSQDIFCKQFLFLRIIFLRCQLKHDTSN